MWQLAKLLTWRFSVKLSRYKRARFIGWRWNFMSHPRALPRLSMFLCVCVCVYFRRYLPISKLFQKKKIIFSHKFYFYRQIFLFSAALFAFFILIYTKLYASTIRFCFYILAETGSCCADGNIILIGYLPIRERIERKQPSARLQSSVNLAMEKGMNVMTSR